MESLYILIPLSVVLIFGCAWWFNWSVKSGQFDDLEGPGHRILMDDDTPKKGHPERPLSSSNAEQSSPKG